MTVETFLVKEVNRYLKSNGVYPMPVILADRHLFDAFAATAQTRTRKVPAVTSVAIPSTRMYQLAQEGWSLILEGPSGRQVGEYLVS